MNFDYDIIALTETWLNKSMPDTFINANSRFNVYRCDRPTRGGGVCILVDKCFSSKVIQVHLPNSYDKLEVLCVDILCSNRKSRIILLYRPPSTNYDNNYHILLVQCLKKLCNCNHEVIILGDMNLPDVDWQTGTFPSNSAYTALCEFFFQFGFHQVVNIPTRDNNILDLIFVHNPNIISSINT